MNSNVDSAKQRLASLRSELTRLRDVLEAERTALRSRDLVAIAAVTVEKTAVCESLSQLMQGPSLVDLVASVHPQARQELDADHKSLLELADSTRDSNIVNGKILARSQQSTRELLTLLSGRTLEGLYGTTGRTDTSGESTARAIAKA